MCTVLITGAAGFIGSQMAYRFMKKGEKLILVDNFSYGKEDNLIFEDYDFRGDVLRIDVRDKDGIANLFRKNNIDYVYHIAAITPLPDCQMRPQEAVDVNVTGTLNILENIRKYGAKKMIFASTSAVYENCNTFPTPEDCVTPPSLVYPSSKYAAEHFCKIYNQTYGINITILRFANVYGPHIDCLRKQPPIAGYLIRSFYEEKNPILHSDGEQRRDFIYVDDVINLSILVREGVGYECLNASTGKTYSINDMCHIIMLLMNRENLMPKYVNPEFFWKDYPGLYEGSYTISKERLSHEVLKRTECDNTRAKLRYGWLPSVGFETGLKNTVDFAVKSFQKEQSHGS